MKVSTKKKRLSKMDILLKHVEGLTKRVDTLENKVGIGWQHDFVPSVDDREYNPKYKKLGLNPENSINVL